MRPRLPHAFTNRPSGSSSATRSSPRRASSRTWATRRSTRRAQWRRKGGDGGPGAFPRRLLAHSHLCARGEAGAGPWRSRRRRCRARRRCRLRRCEQLQEAAESSRRTPRRSRRLSGSGSPARRSARALEAELAALRAEVAAAKAANAAVADTHDYDEAATRDAFIDLLLQRGRLAARQAAGPGVPGHRHAQRHRRGLRRLRALGR